MIIHGVKEIAVLEAIACREAMYLVEDLLLQNFIVAFDSKQVISDIEKGTNITYGHIIKEVKH